MHTDFKLKSKVWIYPGQAAWHFTTLPKKEAQKIKELFAGMTRGFGSIPVTVSLGKSSWKTSIFPDKKSGSFLLPIKAKIRKEEKIGADQEIVYNLKMEAI